MNMATGIFTAPRSGTYIFSFHGNTVKGNDGLVLLRHNGVIFAGSYDTDNFEHNTLGQSAMVKMEVDDAVWVEILSGGVRSNDNLYIHFNGMIIHGS
jgi:hypothetical protein